MSAATWRIALTILIASALACAIDIAQAQGAFYQASEAEIAGPPGSIIREEPIMGAPAGE